MRKTIDGQAATRRLECQAIELNFEFLQLVRDDTDGSPAAFGMSKELTAKIRALDDGDLILLANTGSLLFTPGEVDQFRVSGWKDYAAMHKARMLVFALHKTINDAIAYTGTSSKMVLAAGFDSETTDDSLEDLMDETLSPERKVCLSCDHKAFENMVDAVSSKDDELIAISRNILATS